MDDEADSVIEVKNHRFSPLELVPRLSLPGGERLETTPVTLRPFESRRLGLKRELYSKRELLAEHLTARYLDGSAPLAVLACIRNFRRPHDNRRSGRSSAPGRRSR